MKSYGGLFDQVASFDNLHAAYFEARKRKKTRCDVMKVHENYEAELLDILDRIRAENWYSREYRAFITHRETKQRYIEAPDFRDRIVHHAIVRVLEPIYERKFIYDSFSCRKGKGTHAAVYRLQEFLRAAQREWGSVYVLQCDISKFFPSIRHDILLEILGKTIRERKMLTLIERAMKPDVNSTGVGLPIGALTSQLFSNTYMNELDHFVKEQMGVRFYLRYADDFILLAPGKIELWHYLDDIRWFLDTQLRLKLNPKTAVFSAAQGVDFAGYRTWTTHILPRRRNIVNAKKRFRRLSWLYRHGGSSIEEVRSSLASFFGYIKHCNAHKTAKSVLKNLILRRNRS